MEHLRTTIDNAIYGYNPDEFLPVFYDGHLYNRAEFIAYKAEKFAGALGHLAHRTLHITATVGGAVLNHLANN